MSTWVAGIVGSVPIIDYRGVLISEVVVDLVSACPEICGGSLFSLQIILQCNALLFCSDNKKNECSTTSMTKSRPDISEVPPLNKLITQEQYKALSELSDKVKTTLDPRLGDSVCLGKSTEHKFVTHLGYSHHGFFFLTAFSLYPHL